LDTGIIHSIILNGIPIAALEPTSFQAAQNEGFLQFIFEHMKGFLFRMDLLGI
jgi:hypothetical protein